MAREKTPLKKLADNLAANWARRHCSDPNYSSRIMEVSKKDVPREGPFAYRVLVKCGNRKRGRRIATIYGGKSYLRWRWKGSRQILKSTIRNWF